jgi:hypothetical protein
MGIWRTAVVATGMILIQGGMGSAPQPALAASASEPSDILHEVRPGDDLRLIAGYYYGDTRQWPRIWQANRDQVSNPNRIARGSFLHVPTATVPTESYADFMARARPRAPAVVPPATPKPAAGEVSTPLVPATPGAAPPSLQPPTTPAGQSTGPPPPRNSKAR